MIIFQREIEEKIIKSLFKRSMVIILGPRQSGKTTLSKKIASSFGADGEYFNCELADVRKHFVMGEPDTLLSLVKGKKVVVFDEAQTIENIGKILKVFFDTYPETQIIATGSSSFDLSNKIKEPLTGRAFEFTLLPLSLAEVRRAMPITQKTLHELMTYGSYPAVVGAESKEEKIETLKKIATNYLYKDIFIFETIKNPRIFEELLKLLALQIGSMVSLNELSQSLGTTRATVERYLRLLEQSFVIQKVRSFSNNPRTEIRKAFKVYFLDVGVRNALLSELEPVETRIDKGALFENFFAVGRIKQGALETFPPEIMFWRTRKGIEIDIIEKRGKDIKAFECKWSDADVSFDIFLKRYPNAKTEVVTPTTLPKER